MKLNKISFSLGHKMALQTVLQGNIIKGASSGVIATGPIVVEEKRGLDSKKEISF